MTQPRLLADYAAVPTRRERTAARAENRAAQLGMFDAGPEPDAEPEPICPVCAGPHAEPDCRHGAAPTLELDSAGPRVEFVDRFGRTVPDPYAEPEPDNSPETVAARRAMFAGMGWRTS